MLDLRGVYFSDDDGPLSKVDALRAKETLRFASFSSAVVGNLGATLEPTWSRARSGLEDDYSNDYEELETMVFARDPFGESMTVEMELIMEV